jgi:hypothetical protein
MKPAMQKGAVSALVLFSALGAGCAGMGAGETRPEIVYAVTSSNQLVHFNAGRPESLAGRRPIIGIQGGERIIGIDFRPANGKLYAVGNAGQLYMIDPVTAIAEAVGRGGFRTLAGDDAGFDFNPTVDRIRLVNGRGDNLRLHPDTGSVVDADPNAEGVQIDDPLTYASGDTSAGRTPRITAAAYTNSVAGARTTTNFAIDSVTGALVTQGTREGAATPVSPNTGQLFTVGTLGIAIGQGPVSFDISPAGTGLLAVPANGRSDLYKVDLTTGVAGRLGTIGIAESITGIAIAPMAPGAKQ